MPTVRVWYNLCRRLNPLLDGLDRRARNRPTLQLESLEARTVPTTFYVAPVNDGGNSLPGYGTEAHPFASLQFAVNNAQSGDTIEVAAGTYGYNAGSDVTLSSFGATGVIAITDKQLTILGGFTTSNWTTANPTVNQTIIDGGGKYRGVYVADQDGAAGLDIESFTIQDCLASDNTLTGDIDGFGGGMFVNDAATQPNPAPTILKNVLFQNNTVVGGNATDAGKGVGGGLAVVGGETVSLTNVTFVGNTAIGGQGTELGGVTLGGGFFSGSGGLPSGGPTVTGTGLTFTNNTAEATSVTGQGYNPNDPTKQTSDALGGGFAAGIGSTDTFTNVTSTGNKALGGDAGNSSSIDVAGNGFGGGGYAEGASLTLTNATITGNLAQGGNGFSGGIGGGGGLEEFNADLIFNQVTISNNTAIGGNTDALSDGTIGASGGGGLYLTSSHAGTSITITNAVVTDNTTELFSSAPSGGGGGGAIYLQGVSATVTESTLANNHIQGDELLGPTIVALDYLTIPEGVTFNDDIIQNDSATPSAAPIATLAGAAVTLNSDLFIVPSSSVPLVTGQGTDNATNTMTASSAGFVSLGSNYNLVRTSPAIGQAIDSGVATDRNGNPRPADADLGAYQFMPPTISFANIDTEGLKTASEITVTVTLTSAAPAVVTVHYATSNDTAVAGTDYTPVSGTLTFQAGQTSQTFAIPLLDDGAQTGNLRIGLTLSAPAGLGLGSISHAVATIVDTFPNDNEAFLNGLYESLLGRPADSAGLNFYLAPLQAAETPALTITMESITSSAAYYQNLIGNPTTGFIVTYLGRQATSTDVSYWTNQLQAGATDEEVIAQIMASVEFYTNVAQSSNLVWLQQAYMDILGRPLDSNGQAYWLPLVGSSDDPSARLKVAKQLLFNSEHQLLLIETDYEKYLHRPAGTTDQQYWLSQFQAGLTDEQILGEIAASAEGFANNGNTNVKWITAMNELALGTAPSTAALDNEIDTLESFRGTLSSNPYALQMYYTAQTILGSAEYAARATPPIELISNSPTVNEVMSQAYGNVLGISSNLAGDYAYWQAFFAGNPKQNLDAASAIVGSAYFFNLQNLVS